MEVYSQNVLYNGYSVSLLLKNREIQLAKKENRVC
jgi:hypothetical protein